jgi:hypothetical protein
MFGADFDRACRALFTDQLEKGDLEAAQRSLDTVLKADPTFLPCLLCSRRPAELYSASMEAEKRTECPLGAQAAGLCSVPPKRSQPI